MVRVRQPGGVARRFSTTEALTTRHSLLISNCLVLFEQTFRIKKIFLSWKCICVTHTHLQAVNSALIPL